MRVFTSMSRGEFIGTSLLLLIVTALLCFNFFYETSLEPQPDLTAFADLIAAFEQRQAAYADSVEAARAQRDSAYHSRYRYEKNRYPRHEYPSHRKDSSYYQKDTSRLKPLPKKQSYRIEMVELNTCDTSDIVRIPQFGSKRAQKIVEYRDRLGGFHSLEQLHEIYILQNVNLDYCEKYFTINPYLVKKIKVNTMSYKELKAHPYFDAYLAKTVVAYREKNGKIRNLAEFQKITHAYQELMDKLSPYLSFD
ncbi:MAG: helix-hairpin-helix domain-containing protein [Bacteroidales bacterium]|nr:helix-hairpin-helix domain-containing protein [Bacteroidales bacterium]